ncbi:hemagglutinin repeat-containing protein [Jeongeupia chitinilytica]|uniref:Filamentous haemagglutinin FhaB/tRNA nuclease CdiA-like TPS domain-containing protein n=1 Tax=Jeongeupia chitinilytica TaxID=1041641 RepID=A0ABQ3GX10_9NEIS|nr:hemagglutinin repeat-containing protein [Jeongeupia chitinilytica]GHD57861.1 hypothetical protein GCM10007350_06800 [Jeongeupia chitinilytica]
MKKDIADMANRNGDLRAGLASIELAAGGNGILSFPRRVLLSFTLFCFIAQPVLAAGPIVADPNAPGGQRPTVQTTANGLPVVNIAAPNGAGVSHNKYNQFNVDAKGAILNNSPGLVQTQLGGYVDGNANLAGGAARTILNEVTSGNPSALRGYLEVAGQRANIIVANPNGISCDGCGFINSNRATLTTGTPVFGGSGSLDAFRVGTGLITVSGAGLNGGNLDQVDLIARAVRINAGVYARHLNVVAGTATANYADLAVQAGTGDADAPGVSIDVAQLGGMYADKIRLIGTEAGVGVNLVGTIAATQDLQIDSAGKLTLGGKTTAATAMLSGAEIANTGQLYVTQSLAVKAAGQLVNTGVIASAQHADLQTGSLAQQGMLAAGLSADGQIQGNGSLTVASVGNASLTGQTVAAGNATVRAASIDASGGKLQSANALDVQATQGDVTFDKATVSAGSTLAVRAAAGLNTRGATVSARQLTMAGRNIDNSGGSLAQTGAGTLQVSATEAIVNRGGLIGANGELQLNAAMLDNSGRGQLQAKRLALTVGQLDNRQGSIRQTGSQNGSFSISDTLDNRKGVIATNAQDLSLSAVQLDNAEGQIVLTGNGKLSLNGALDNSDGKVASNGDVAINAGTLNNARGQIAAQRQLDVVSGSVLNRSGTMAAGKALRIDNVGAFDNRDGAIEAGEGLTFRSGSLNNDGLGRVLVLSGDGVITADTVSNQGTLGGNGNVLMTAGRLDNTGALSALQALTIKAAQLDNGGKLVTASALQLTAQHTTNSGTIQGDLLSIAGMSLINAGGQLIQVGNGDAQWALTDVFDNRGGAVGSAARSLTLNAGQLTNTGRIGLSGSGQHRIDAAELDNSGGQLIQAGAGSMIVTASNELANRGGLIGSAGTLKLNAATLDNSNAGQLQADRLALTVGQLNNQQGSIRQTGAQNGSFAISGALDNRKGTIATNAKDLTLVAAQIDNAEGQIALAGDGKLSLTGPLDNSGGKLVSNGDIAIRTTMLTNAQGQVVAQRQLDIDAQSVNNQSGSLASGAALVINSAGALDSTNGNIEAGNGLTLNTGSLNNGGRTVAVAGNATVTATGNIVNTGTLGANGQLQLNGKQLSNSGTLTSMQDLGIAAETLNNSGTVVAAKQVTFNATQSVGNSGTVQAERLAVTTPTLSNSGGKFIQTGTINGAWTIASLLDNRNGSISSAAQDLALQSARILNGSGRIAHAGTGLLSLTGTLDNAAGQVGSNGAIRISTDQFGNVAGNVAAYRGLTVTAQNLNNTAGGVLTASDVVDLGVSGTLDNTGGTVEGGNGLSASAATLNNGANGRLVAVSGDSRISAGSQLSNAGLIGGNGNVTVTAPQLNNTGMISAGQLLDVSGNELGNRGGQLQGRSVAVRANGKLDNEGGKVDAANALSATAASIDNASGRIANSGSAQTTVSAGAGLNNSNGLIGGNGNTQIGAATLTNTGGTLTSGADLGVTATTQLNNGGGTLFAVGNTSVNTPLFNNAGGVLNGRGDASISASQTDNSGGRIATNRNIMLTSAGFYGLGDINAGNDLTLNLQGDINLVAGMGWTANHDLTLNTNGNIDNRTRFGAVGTLSLNGANVYNRAGAELSGNDGLRISTGYLQNEGTLFGDRVELGAGSILNRNAIFGGDVTLRAGSIANAGNGNPDSSIIAAGRNLNLYTGDLTNTAGGDLYSLGNLNIAAQDGVGNAGRVLNQSSTIQGDGDVGIRAGEIRNQWDSITYSEISTSTEPVKQTTTSQGGEPVGGPPGGGSTTTTTVATTYTTTTDATVSTSGRAGKILAGGQLALAGGSVINDASVIAAGGNASVDQNLLQNVGYQAYRRITETQSGEKTVETKWCGGGAGGNSGGCGSERKTFEFGPITTVIEDVLKPGISASFTAGGSISGNAGTIRNITTGLHTPAIVGSTINANGVARLDPSTVNTGGGQLAAIAAPVKLTGQGPATQSAVDGPTLTGPTTTQTNASQLQGQGQTTAARVAGVGLRGDPISAGYQLPTSGLYRINPMPDQKYLVETDPRFTQYGKFISSDYMLGRLNIDPSATHKRLGDAFYENKLVTDQIAQLTGRRFLDGYTDQQAEYQALMDAGAAYAQQFGITPGISLSGEQMASLTRDMVWLETRVVNGQSVLVPVVYLAGVEQNVMQTGQGMLAADSIDLRTGTLSNSGVIQSQTATKIAATQISNLGGTISSTGSIDLAATGDLLNQSGLISGNAVKLVAGNDLTNLTVAGMRIGTIQAGDSLAMNAGRDMVLTASQLDAKGNVSLDVGRNLVLDTLATTKNHTQTGKDLGNGWFLQDGTTTTTSQTTFEASSISAGKNLAIKVGNDVNATAATLKAGDQLTLLAGGDVTLKAAKETASFDQRIGGDRYHLAESSERLVSTTIEATNNITIGAGQGEGKHGNLTVTSSDVLSEKGKIQLAATGDVNLGAQIETESSLTETHQKTKGFFKKSETRTRDETVTTTAVGSTISGDSVAIVAGNNLNVVGSNVVGTNDVDLRAGKDVNIVAATNTVYEERYREEKKSGLSVGLMSMSYDKQQSKDHSVADATKQSQSRSLVGSTEGNLTIVAGGDANILGSDLSALQGDLGIRAQNINISNGIDTLETQENHERKQSGLSTKVVGTPIDTVRNLQDTVATKKGYAAYDGVMKELGASVFNTPDVDISFGRSQSQINLQSSSQAAIGSTLNAGGDIKLIATGSGVLDANGKAVDGNINVIGSVVQGGGKTTLAANGNVNVVASNSESESSSSQSSSGTRVSLYAPQLGDVGRGISGGPDNSGTSLSPYNQSRTEGHSEQQNSRQTASLISGSQVSISSSTSDILIAGSAVTGLMGVDLAAAGNISIVAGNDAQRSNQQASSLTLGDLGGTGNSQTNGIRRTEDSARGAGNTQSTIRSEITSAFGDVNITAGEALHIAGADIAAGNDAMLIGKQVQIDPGVDQYRYDEAHKMSQTGVTTKVSSPIESAVQTVVAMAEQGRESSDARTKALAAGTAALATYNAVSAATVNPTQMASVSGSITFGQSKSQSTSTQQSALNSGSSVQAGRDLIIAATGAGETSNLNLIGSDISAGRDITLLADNKVNLLAALDTNSEHSKNSGSSWGIGVAASVGAGGFAVGITVEASTSKGHVDGEERTWQNSHVGAGENLTIVSGGDTNLRGAVASAEQVSADVGGDLNIESLQDTHKYDSKQTSAGGSITVGIGASTGSGGVSFSGENMKNDYASVIEQSGIVAGEGGFQIKVKGNTDLTGAVIASTADADKNSLTTGSLSYREIENHAEYSGSSVGLAVSGGIGDDKKATDPGPGFKAGSMEFATGVSATVPVVLGASGEQSSTTHSAISAGSIVITDAAKQQEKTGQTVAEAVAGISRDTSNAHQALNDEFDAKEVHGGFVVTQAFVQEVGTFQAVKAQEADAKEKAFRNEKDPEKQKQLKAEYEEALKWAPGGTYSQVLTAFTVATGSNVAGGIGQLAQVAVVKYVQGMATNQVKQLADMLDSEAARAALQGLVGCAGGQASGSSCSSGALGAAGTVVMSSLLDQLMHKDPALMSAGEKKERENLVAALMGGIVAAAGGNVAEAVGASQIEMANNRDSPQQMQQIMLTARKLDRERIERMFKAGDCASVSPQQCVAKMDDRQREELQRFAITLGTLLPVMGEVDAIKTLITGMDLNGDEVHRFWGVLGVVTAGYGQKGKLLVETISEASVEKAAVLAAAEKTAGKTTQQTTKVVLAPRPGTLDDLNHLPEALPSKSGNLCKSKVLGCGVTLSVHAEDQALVDTIRKNGDLGGTLTEELAEKMAARSGYESLAGKYGANNGFDHVLIKEGSDGSVLILDSKQMKKFSTRLEMNAAGGYPQLSDEWVNQVLRNLDVAAAKASFSDKAEIFRTINLVKDAMLDGKLKTAVIAVDKTTGNVMAVPVKVGGVK